MNRINELRSVLLVTSALAFFLAIYPVNAFNQEGVRSKSNSGVGIEIIVPQTDRPPFYVSAKRSDSQPMFALIRPVLVSNALRGVDGQVSMIKVVPYLEEDNSVKMKVFVLYGELGRIDSTADLKDIKVKEVASCFGHPGEVITVSELKPFGAEPIEIRVKGSKNQAPVSHAKEKSDESSDSEFSQLEQLSISLIREAAKQASGLDDRRSSVRIQSAAADALWEKDQESARKLFRDAFETAINYYAQSQDVNLRRVGRGLFISGSDLRLEVMRFVAKRDPSLSRVLMDRYVTEKQREYKEKRDVTGGGERIDPVFGKVDAAAGNLLEIAGSLFEVDRTAALGMARRAFSTGIPQAAGYFITQLAEKDRAAADQLYILALDRLDQDEAPVPGQLLLLSAYPFGEGQVWVSSGDGVNSYEFRVPEGFVLDEQLIRGFITLAFKVLSRTSELDMSQFPDGASRIGAALFASRLLEPKVNRFFPGLTADWQTLNNRLTTLAGKSHEGVNQALEEISQKQPTDWTLTTHDRIRRLLQQAERTSNLSQRDDLYQEAALEADRVGDTAQALTISAKIWDLDQRQKMRRWIYFNAALRALKESRFDEARRFALEVDATDQRAYLFFEIARVAIKEKDQAGASTLLNEAMQRAVSAENTTEKLRALLGIAGLYANFDPLRGFEVVAEAVRTANKVLDYGPDQARLVRTIDSHSGRGSSVSVSNVEEFDFGKTLATLGRQDFDRAIMLAQSLESKPLKLLTTITLAASVFERKRPAPSEKASPIR